MAQSKHAIYLDPRTHNVPDGLPDEAEWENNRTTATFMTVKHFTTIATRYNASLKSGRIVDVSWAHEIDDVKRRNHANYPTGANAARIHREVNIECFALVRALLGSRKKLPELDDDNILNPSDYDNDASAHHIRDAHGNIIERMPLVAIALRMIANLGFQGPSIVNGQLRQQCQAMKLPTQATQKAINGFKNALQSIVDAYKAATSHPNGQQVIAMQSDHMICIKRRLINSPNPLNLDIQDFANKHEDQTQLTNYISALKTWAEKNILEIMAHSDNKVSAYMATGGGSSGTGMGCPLHPNARHTKEQCNALKNQNKNAAAKGPKFNQGQATPQRGGAFQGHRGARSGRGGRGGAFKPPYSRPTTTTDPSGRYKGKNYDPKKSKYYQQVQQGVYHAMAAIAKGAPSTGTTNNGAAASSNGAPASGNASVSANTANIEQVVRAMGAGTFAFACTINETPNEDGSSSSEGMPDMIQSSSDEELTDKQPQEAPIADQPDNARLAGYKHIIKATPWDQKRLAPAPLSPEGTAEYQSTIKTLDLSKPFVNELIEEQMNATPFPPSEFSGSGPLNTDLAIQLSEESKVIILRSNSRAMYTQIFQPNGAGIQVDAQWDLVLEQAICTADAIGNLHQYVNQYHLRQTNDSPEEFKTMLTKHLENIERTMEIPSVVIKDKYKLHIKASLRSSFAKIYLNPAAYEYTKPPVYIDIKDYLDSLPPIEEQDDFTDFESEDDNAYLDEDEEVDDIESDNEYLNEDEECRSVTEEDIFVTEEDVFGPPTDTESFSPPDMDYDDDESDHDTVQV